MPTTTHIFTMEPSPISNPQGRLDGAWRVKRTLFLDGQHAHQSYVARFAFDGRDNCEAWAHRHFLTFGVRYPVGA